MIYHKMATFLLVASLLVAGGCSDDTDTHEDTSTPDVGADTTADVDTAPEDTGADAAVDAAEDTGADVDLTSPDVEPSLQGDCGDIRLRKIHHQGEMQQDVIEAEIPYNYGIAREPGVDRYFYLTSVAASAERTRELYEIVFEVDPSTPHDYIGGGIENGRLVLGQSDHPDADYVVEDSNVVEFNFSNGEQNMPTEPVRVKVEKKERGRPGDVWVVALYECWDN